MKVKKQVIIKEEQTEKVFCNKCGGEIKKHSSGEFFDYLQVEKVWGYFSSMDGEKHVFDICEKCYKEFIESFKISADK